VVVHQDISEHKQAQQALQAAQLVLESTLTLEKQLARTDPLTGVNNRRHLYELAQHEFEVSQRYRQPLSVMMFDLDHFKKVNDTYGHQVGDQVLRLTTQVVGGGLRSADIIGRYGGEEFIVLLPMTTAQQAFALAERIRNEVAQVVVETEKGSVSVTISIGVVAMDETSPAESVESLFRRADEAMYGAKQSGRNRTVIG